MLIIVSYNVATRVLSNLSHIEDSHLVVHGGKISLQLLNLGLKQLLLVPINLVLELDFLLVHTL